MPSSSSRNTTKSLDDLFAIAEENNIPVDENRVPCVESMTVNINDSFYIIGLGEPLENSGVTKNEMLAHELGHCMTNSFYHAYSPLETRERLEYRANKWAIKTLVPFSKLCRAVKNGYRESWELAEYFDVSESFIEKAIEYYRLHNQEVPLSYYQID